MKHKKVNINKFNNKIRKCKIWYKILMKNSVKNSIKLKNYNLIKYKNKEP